MVRDHKVGSSSLPAPTTGEIMKKILCYGDSNTWGYISGSDGERYDSKTRYAKILQDLLGSDFDVIEEGLPGRTCGADSFSEIFGNKNGTLFFKQCVYAQSPLDYVLIFSGTNDMKIEFNRTPKDCAFDLEYKYILPLKTGLNGKIKQIPKIIIVAPAKIDDGCWGIFENANIKSKSFNNEYEKIAKKYDCLFVSNNELINGVDKVHLTKESHNFLAHKIFKILKNDLNQ